jgi:alkaline phosphatase D
VVAQGEAQADARFAHSVHVEVAGLMPGRDYWYRFSAMGAQSPVGHARTTVTAQTALDRLRFSFVSCSHWEEGWFGAYRRIAEERPDLVIFLGDYIYEYNNQGKHLDGRPRRHVGPEATDLPTYRNRYALYRTDPDLQAVHAAAPSLMTWDDHEVENDYADKWSEHPETPPDAFLKRRAAAYQAFYEHMPLRRMSLPNGPDMKVYDRFRFGNLVEMPILDGRQYRSMGACPTPTWRGGHVVPPTCTERDDPKRTMLGFAQEKWLAEGFRRSDARWNIVAQDLLVASFIQEGKDGVTGHWTDGWDGYPACRARVLEAVRDSKVANPVFIGGDIHSFWTTDLKVDFDRQSPTVATEFVGGSITSDAPPYEAFAKHLPESPHVKYFESRAHGYVSVDVTPERMETRFMSVDRLNKDAPAQVLAKFVVRSGVPGALPA